MIQGDSESGEPGAPGRPGIVGAALASVAGRLSPVGRGVITAGLGLTLVSLLFCFRAQAQFQRASFPDELDRYYLPPPAQLKLASLGYREAAADLVWVATVQHGSDRRFQGGRRFPWLELYLDATLALNPYMLKVYLWADGTLTYSRGRMRNRDWQTTIRYLERGHKAFPRNWEILFKISCAYSEMDSKDAAQLSRWRRTAADYLWKAHLVGGGPPWLGSLAARYWSEEGRWHLAYRRTLEEFKSTDSEKVKKEMAGRLAELLGQSSSGASLSAHFSRFALPALGNPAAAGLVFAGELLQERQVMAQSAREVREMEEERKEFDSRHTRCLPYASADLYVLIGPCTDHVSRGGLPQRPAPAAPARPASPAPRTGGTPR